ncbi:MAG TPA: GAF domain-containing protein [Terriglobales bacterium]|jgi:L-methionine (R)-S-oxide reductase|nr:GAF domain-containing protein [Terriglobales bacterium]
MATKSDTKLDEVRKAVDRLNSEALSPDQLMDGITLLLNKEMLKYNWVGFYMLEAGANPPMLALGHYQGAMTVHTRISLHQGICGAAASSGKTVVVDDVKKDPRYLACSIETKSEIVVPVFVHGKVAGELDIDSHFLAAFADEDRELVEYCAQLVGKRLEDK